MRWTHPSSSFHPHKKRTALPELENISQNGSKPTKITSIFPPKTNQEEKPYPLEKHVSYWHKSSLHFDNLNGSNPTPLCYHRIIHKETCEKTN
ncbi:hypothetical protein VNO77_39406 [Canavalia gladiata]|uniref:Uncharacterized protein n=1 Tax=Canavalia gladiata TaxID=3824 RepID=A0AAN9PZR3_CANGL